jgi:glycosyltransferase involved in cell wall biosynthesis
MTNAEPRLMTSPSILVLSSLFPHAGEPGAGSFVRERMFRVARQLPLRVVSPKPWFPGQGLIQRLRPGYRPAAAAREDQQGVEVLFPHFLSLPGMARHWDGRLMALSVRGLLERLQRDPGFDLIDAHFAYPDGDAACLLSRWLGVPYTLTLRGTEVPHARNPRLLPRLRQAMLGAARVIGVSDSLRRLAVGLGVPEERTTVVGNGVDIGVFHPVDRAGARLRYRLPEHARVLVTVGGLVERKGFHRVIACLPELLARHPDLHYLVVGGPCREGDMGPALRQQAESLGVAERVHFLGALPPAELKWPLSAADVFVLSTRNEGWANVILEAMACGLPVVASDVGGNREVVADDRLGHIVPFDDHAALRDALDNALARDWDRQAILAYARDNNWDGRVDRLLDIFGEVLRA